MDGIIRTQGESLNKKLIGEPSPQNIRGENPTKALGAQQNNELAAWYEDAYAYYQEVRSGQAETPEPAAWEEFLNQMRWAYDQLTGIPTWDPLPTSGSSPLNEPADTAADPFGGQIGPNGTLIHNQERTQVGFIGDDHRDIWSNDIEIDVAPLSAQVQVARVMDESTEPPAEVLKIIVTDPATGTQAVYIVHDYEDAQIKINVPSETQVEDRSGLVPSPIEVGKFEPTLEGTNSQASIDGEAHEEHDHYTIYEGRIGQKIEFFPEAGGDGEQIEYNEVYGDSAIYTKLSDHVSVLQGIHEMGFDQQDGYTVVVTHRDGTQDVYFIHKGYDVQLGAKPEYVSWNGGEEGAEDEIPGAFEDHIRYLGNESTSIEGSPNNLHPEDSRPDETQEATAFYNTQDEVSLHNDFGGEIETHHITTSGTVEITAENFSDQATVILLPNGNFLIEMTNESGEKINYILNGPPSHLYLNGFLPNQVNVYRASDADGTNNTHIYNFRDGATALAENDDLEKITGIEVTAENAKNPNELENTLQTETPDETLRQLMDLTGKNEEQIINALKAAGLTQWDSIEELSAAMEDNQGQFPLDINQAGNLEQIIRFLYALDPQFSSFVNGASRWEKNTLANNYHAAAVRLVDLLKALFPNENISLNLNAADPSQWWRNNQIVVNGNNYNFTNDHKNHTTEIQVTLTNALEAHPG